MNEVEKLKAEIVILRTTVAHLSGFGLNHATGIRHASVAEGEKLVAILTESAEALRLLGEAP